MPGKIQVPAIEPRLTMWPRPRAFMPGTVAARQFRTPRMFTSSSRSMSSGEASQAGVERTERGQHGGAVGDVEDERDAAGLLGERLQRLDRARDGVDRQALPAQAA